LTLLVGQQEGHPACKKYGGWQRLALVSPDVVAPSGMVGVSACVNLPLHHKVQKFASETGSPAWSWKKGHKTVVVVEYIEFMGFTVKQFLFAVLNKRLMDKSPIASITE